VQEDHCDGLPQRESSIKAAEEVWPPAGVSAQLASQLSTSLIDILDVRRALGLNGLGVG
jgi:hypothetical protein